MHKAGFVNIIGSPNVGKSTLMNILVGERLSIITNKAQTTRHRIMGIVSGDDYQIVYSDTPGVLMPVYKLQDTMLDAVNMAFSDADVILLVVEVFEKQINNEEIFRKILDTKTPILLLLNKIDLATQEELAEKSAYWKEKVPNAEIIPISALNKFGGDYVKQRIIELLPESPAYYDKEQLTDKPERFFVSEIVREKILLYYQKEIPYSVEILVNSFKDEPEIVKIEAEIMVMRESQRAIIIGHEGKALKKMGTEARKSLERFFGKKVFIKLFVKVDKDWRDNELKLKRYGYGS